MFETLLLIFSIFNFGRAHYLPTSYSHDQHYGHAYAHAPATYDHVGYHLPVVPAGSTTTTNYVYPGYHDHAHPAASTTNQVVYPSYHDHAHPAVSTTNQVVYPGYHDHIHPVVSSTNQVAYPSYHDHAHAALPVSNHVAYPTYHEHAQPVVSAVHPVVYPSYHGHAHPGIPTSRYGHGHGYAYSSHYHPCRTTYGTWSAWGTCTAVHTLIDGTTACGRGRQIRHRQRNQPAATSTFSYYGIPRVRYPTCTSSCAPAKELFQVQECIITGQVTCVEAANTLILCDFETAAAADLPCSTAVGLQAAGLSTLMYKFTSTLVGTNNLLQIGSNPGGVVPAAAYWPTLIFPVSDDYKYCIKYKAQLDVGTMLFVTYLTIPTAAPPSSDTVAILAGNALLNIDSNNIANTCEGEGVIKCNMGTTSTTSLTSYQEEITVKDNFGVGFFMIPSVITTGTGFSGGQLDDVQVVPGGC